MGIILPMKITIKVWQTLLLVTTVQVKIKLLEKVQMMNLEFGNKKPSSWA